MTIIRETCVLVSKRMQVSFALIVCTSKIDVKGELVYPASFGAGFIIEQLPDVKQRRLAYWGRFVKY